MKTLPYASPVLGFCSKRQESVTDGACLDCFTDRAHTDLRAEAHQRRTACVDAHITNTVPDLLNGNITASNLSVLDEAALRHIIGNAVMIALEDPDSPTGRVLLAEARLHLSLVVLP